MSTTVAIRAVLRFSPDGLTLNEIAAQSGVPYRAVHRAVAKMPDAYIDRWKAPVGAYPYQAVWCVVPVPDNCPHPREDT